MQENFPMINETWDVKQLEPELHCKVRTITLIYSQIVGVINGPISVTVRYCTCQYQRPCQVIQFNLYSSFEIPSPGNRAAFSAQKRKGLVTDLAVTEQLVGIFCARARGADLYVSIFLFCSIFSFVFMLHLRYFLLFLFVSCVFFLFVLYILVFYAFMCVLFVLLLFCFYVFICSNKFL